MSLTHIPMWQLLKGPETFFKLCSLQTPPTPSQLSLMNIPHSISTLKIMTLVSSLKSPDITHKAPSPNCNFINSEVLILWADINVLHLGGKIPYGKGIS